MAERLLALPGDHSRFSLVRFARRLGWLHNRAAAWSEQHIVAVMLEGSEALLERATRELRSALGRAGVPETRVADAGAREAYQRILDAYLACLGERSVTYRIASFASACETCAMRSLDLFRTEMAAHGQKLKDGLDQLESAS